MVIGRTSKRIPKTCPYCKTYNLLCGNLEKERCKDCDKVIAYWKIESDLEYADFHDDPLDIPL
jgi:phage FluMu protein Com